MKKLKKTQKILSVIVRPGQENITWFKSLGDNAFIVLYGYDLHTSSDSILPVSPNKYQQRLTIAVTHLIQVAEEARMPIMGGIPVVATTYECMNEKIDTRMKLSMAVYGRDNFYNFLSNNYFGGFLNKNFSAIFKQDCYCIVITVESNCRIRNIIHNH